MMKKIIKNKNIKHLKLKKNNLLKQVIKSKPPLNINVNFFKNSDGAYSSYWVGKLINTLLIRGNKKTVAKHLYNSFLLVKYALGSNPLLVLLETLDKIKPSFRLRNYIVRRVIIKEYPIVTLRPRQYMLAIHWLKTDIRNNLINRFGTSLSGATAEKLIEFRLNPKKNNLIKQRNDYTKRIIAAQFNVRYSWK